MLNAESEELNRFDHYAHQWWDAKGAFRGLHDINPVRLDWIDQSCPLNGLSVADIGCGGGLLAEGLAARGATVTGIDLSERSLSVAKLHLLESGLRVNYQQRSAEEFAEKHPETFDLVTCLELLEHVPEPESVVRACARLAKPGGSIFFSTLNQTIKARFLALWVAEQVIGLIPKNTHRYDRFIKPSKLVHWAQKSGLKPVEIRGLDYSPFSRRCQLSRDTRINYLLHTIKE